MVVENVKLGSAISFTLGHDVIIWGEVTAGRVTSRVNFVPHASETTLGYFNQRLNIEVEWLALLIRVLAVLASSLDPEREGFVLFSSTSRQTLE